MLPVREVHARRLRSQLLSGPPAPDAVSVVDRLLAVQAQDLRGARLAVRARSTVGRVAEVDAALDDGSLVVTWLLRGTLHLVRASDHWWLHDLVAARHVTANRRRLRQEGVDDDAAAQRRGGGGDDGAAARPPPPGGDPCRARRRRGAHRRPGAGARVDGSVAGRPHRPRPRPWAASRPSWRPTRGWGHARPPWTAPRRSPASVPATWPATVPGMRRTWPSGRGWGCGTPVPRSPSPAPAPDARAPELPAPRLLGPFDPVLLGWADRTDVIGSHTGVITEQRRLPALRTGRRPRGGDVADGTRPGRGDQLDRGGRCRGPRRPGPGCRGGRRLPGLRSSPAAPGARCARLVGQMTGR